MKLSQQLNQIRDEITKVRSNLTNFRFEQKGWGERTQCVEGALTCGIVSLYNTIEELIKYEIKMDDLKFGKSIKFSSRGTGLDICPGCFVCGTKTRHENSNDYLNNISAFVSSKQDGEEAVSWFPRGARLDFREREPNRIQVKIGACDTHLSNLIFLDERIRSNNYVIRQIDVKESIDLIQQIH